MVYFYMLVLLFTWLPYTCTELLGCLFKPKNFLDEVFRDTSDILMVFGGHIYSICMHCPHAIIIFERATFSARCIFG